MRWASRIGCAPRRLLQVLLTTTGINDQPDNLGLADIDHFAQFVRGTMVPPRDTVLAATPAALKGQKHFRQVGCNVCHMEAITTAPVGTVIDGGMFTVPEALGDKIIHPSATSCCMTSELEMESSRSDRKTLRTN